MLNTRSGEINPAGKSAGIGFVGNDAQGSTLGGVAK